jgi:hypothetical protein
MSDCRGRDVGLFRDVCGRCVRATLMVRGSNWSIHFIPSSVLPAVREH